MENKATFGSFILKRRKELGMTQKEFASQLFVTESAVSKWERGLSYPDITLLQNICAVLEVNEHELLSGGEDTKQRNSDMLAARYLKLTRNYRLTQYIIYGAVLLICAICNIAVSHRLDWFFIVLPSVMTAASLTLVPAICAVNFKLDRFRPLITFGCFLLSLELLLLACAVYTSGSWFVVAAVSVLFGTTLVCLPFLLPKAPLPEALQDCKTSLYIGIETALLLLLLLVCAVYYHGDWFVVTAVSVVFGLGLFLLPVLLRQIKLPEALRSCKATLYIGAETVLLLLLLLVCAIHSRGSWFPIAAVSVLFGLGLFLLPIPLRQIPLPGKLSSHKTLIYFSIETVLLLLVVVLGELNTRDPHLGFSLGLTLLLLTLPWAVMLILRYLPVNGFLRASAACGWTAFWMWLAPWGMQKLWLLSNDEPDMINFNGYTLGELFRFSENGWFSTPWGRYGITMLVLAISAIVLLCLGLRYGRKGPRDGV